MKSEKLLEDSLDEMNNLLTPSLYIGRCPEQVETFVSKIKPQIADVSRETAEINL